MHRDGTRASRGCPRAARASLHLGGRACVAYTVRCAHLSLACRAGLCRCRAAESVKGAARVQDSRLESGSRGVCCERFDREHTPGPTCWAVNFCLLSVVAASAVALRGPARSGRRAPARGSLRTGALDRRGPNALGPQRDTSRAPLSRSALHSLHLGHSRRRGSSSVHSTPLSCATRSSCSQIASWTLAAHRTLHLVCGLPPRLLSLRSGGPTRAVGCSRAEIVRRATVRRDRCAARRRLCSPQGRGMPIAHRQRVRFPPAAHVAQLAPTPLSSTCRA